jgi:hypothetical protein
VLYSRPLVSTSVWLQGDHRWGEPVDAQDAESGLYCCCMVHFPIMLLNLCKESCLSAWSRISSLSV